MLWWILRYYSAAIVIGAGSKITSSGCISIVARWETDNNRGVEGFSSQSRVQRKTTTAAALHTIKCARGPIARLWLRLWVCCTTRLALLSAGPSSAHRNERGACVHTQILLSRAEWQICAVVRDKARVLNRERSENAQKRDQTLNIFSTMQESHLHLWLVQELPNLQ